ncbi:hypothetical protein RHMOL_Rhmol05G0264500 [Rhododendron molle]|uniref:Uncharacterized protein n=1 Tax=Rhododendron molle TaxID=49168 RepID=A0ACC0NUD9_RHOML|nr:hypothetical protein RHMOL_Rhmol05G0264500 [Rhododendron molle]
MFSYHKTLKSLEMLSHNWWSKLLLTHKLLKTMLSYNMWSKLLFCHKLLKTFKLPNRDGLRATGERPQVIQEQNIVDEQPAIEVLAAAGGGNIEVPVVIQEQNAVNEPPAIEELAGAGGENIEVPVVIQEQNIVDEQPAIEELAGAEVPATEEETPLVDSVVTQETPLATEQAKERPTIAVLTVGQDFLGVETSNFGDIGSFEESDNETLNVECVSGEIKELRVKFETAKKELSRIVLADAFSLNALQDVLREKLPFEFEPFEMNALKDLLVKKFITKWPFYHMQDFDYIFERMVVRGLGSDLIVLESSEGKLTLSWKRGMSKHLSKYFLFEKCT